MAEPVIEARALCPGCMTELSSNLLVCPTCQRLVHADELKALVRDGEQHVAAGRHAEAAAAWSRALSLLPAGTRQHEAVHARWVEAEAKAQQPGARQAEAGWKGMPKALAALGALGLLLWKLKFLAAFFALKLPTLLTFAAALAVYWAAWGWQFALGFLLCMYVHELGHVAAARRFGLPVSAPMFVPGFGAFIRLRAHPRTASEEAWIGLAGPLAGMAATAACAGLALALGSKLLAAVASGSALLNLFNLVPIWQLDGARAYHGLTRAQQVIAALSLAAAWLITNDGLVGLIAIVAIGRALTVRARKDASDWRAATAFAASAVGLAALAWVTIPLAT